MKILLISALVLLIGCSEQSSNIESKKSPKSEARTNITWDSGTQILNDISNGGTELDYPTIQANEGDNINIPLRLGFKDTQDVQVFSLSLYDSGMTLPDTSCFSKTYSGEVTSAIYCDFIVNVSSVESGTKAYQMRLLIKEDGLFKSKYFTVYVSTEDSPVASGGDVSYIGLTSEDPAQLDYGKLSSISQRTIRIKDEDSSDGSLLSIDYSQLTSFRITYDSCRSRSRDKCVLRISAPFPNPAGKDSDQYTESFFVNGQKVDLMAQYDAQEAEPPTDEEQTEVDNNTVTFEDIDDLQYVTLTVKNDTTEDWENIEVSDIPPFVNKIYDSCEGNTLAPNRQCIIRLSFNASDYTGDDAVGTMFVSALPYAIDIISIKKGDTIPAPGTVTFTHLDNIDLSTLTETQSVYVTDLNEASFNVKGTCSEDDLDVEIFINTVKLIDADCSGNVFDTNIDLSDRILVPEGLSTLLGMNFGGEADLEYVIRDSSANIDLLAISDITSELENIKDLSGTCDLVDFGSIISLDLGNDGSIESTIACSNSGSFEFEDIDFSSYPNGSISVKVSYTDSAGNYAEDIESFNKNIISLVDCSEAQAQANGYDVSYYDQVLGQTDGSDVSSCTISCHSGYTLNNFACTKSCEESDAISNSVDTLNFLAIKGDVIGSDVSQCLIDSCQSGYEVSGDERSCQALAVACTETDAQSNGANTTNFSTIEGNVVSGDVSACLISSCVEGYVPSSDQKSCETFFPLYKECSIEYYNAYSSQFASEFPYLIMSDVKEVTPKARGGIITADRNRYSVAILKGDNTIQVFGRDAQGGDQADVSSITNVKEIFPAEEKFSALLNDGSVKVWGKATEGADQALADAALLGITSPVKKVYANKKAFAALLEDGSVKVWGEAGQGGDQAAADAAIGSGTVKEIVGAYASFAALLDDGSVKVWGSTNLGGDQAEVNAVFLGITSPVKKIYANYYAYAALLEDGSVRAWGNDSYGGDQTEVDSAFFGITSNIKEIYANEWAFAALMGDGDIRVWGHDSYGGNQTIADIFLTTKKVKSITIGKNSFAGHYEDNTMFTWGGTSNNNQIVTINNYSVQNSPIKKIHSSGSEFYLVQFENNHLINWQTNTTLAPQYDSVILNPVNNQSYDFKDIIVASIGNYGSIGVLNDGSLVHWGFTGALSTEDSATVESILSGIGTEHHYSEARCNVSECESGFSITGDVNGNPTSCQ